MPYVLSEAEEELVEAAPPEEEVEVSKSNRVIGQVTANGKTRDLTEDDYAWALRSVLGEAGGAAGHEWEWAAVLWTMANRWLGMPAMQQSSASFGQYIQRFSQPVNPNQIGVIHPYDKTADDPTGQRHSQERDVRIRAFRARSAESIARQYPALAAYVMKFFKGQVSREPFANFANFAAPSVQKSLPVVGRAGGNVFYSEPWIGTLDVVILGARRLVSSPIAIAAGLTLVAIGSLIGYYYWTKAKRLPRAAL